MYASTPVSLVIQMMTVSLLSLQRQMNYNKNVELKDIQSEYDYIVIGSGTGGGIVAARLAEDPHTRILLLEAGGPQTVTSDIPANADGLIDADQDWRFRTAPQPYFTGVGVDYNMGLLFGGSSSYNGMHYNRGNRRHYDEWVHKYGAQGWSYDEVMPYWLKSERNTDPNIVAANPGFHGTSGPLVVSSDLNPRPIILLHEQAVTEWGFKRLDINGASQAGTMIAQSNIDQGWRHSVANAYLTPRPKNLDISIESFVTKILIDKTHGLTATGVQFDRKGKTYTVRARKEVILSAGMAMSPKLLMLSGIGHKHHLESFGIPVLADLPVGDNIQDHPASTIHTIIDPRTVGKAAGPGLVTQQLYPLLINGTGPLSRGTNSMTYVSTSHNPDPEWPNTFFYSTARYNGNLAVMVNEFPSQTAAWRDYFGIYNNTFILESSPHLFLPRSFGTVRLASKDPYVHPVIDPKMLSDPQDYAEMVEITKFVLKFLLTSSVSKWISFIPKPIPGCQYCPKDIPLWECDSYVQCLIRLTGKSGYHYGGGNRMGDPKRADTVVDPKLRVKHVTNLRVCDGSVMPAIPNSNTNAAVIMIGEKCADLIKQDSTHSGQGLAQVYGNEYGQEGGQGYSGEYTGIIGDSGLGYERSYVDSYGQRNSEYNSHWI